jgi:hypothetical protein
LTKEVGYLAHVQETADPYYVLGMLGAGPMPASQAAREEVYSGDMVVGEALGYPVACLLEIGGGVAVVLLPLLFFGGLKLLQREAWGYVLGGLLLVKALVTGSTLAFTTALGAWWVGAVAPFDAFLFVVFVLLAVGALLLLVPYLHSLEK